MKSAFALLATLSLSALAIPAYAADDMDELDGGKGDDKKDKKTSDAPVREIVKGFYARANVGGAFFLGSLNGFVDPGTFSSLAVGQDFVDSEKLSMAWELSFSQGVHNGCYYEDQADYYCDGNLKGKASPLIQGDLRTYTLAGGLEASFYPNRRIGVGILAGGGVMLAPLLMDEVAYQEDVVNGAWGGVDGGYHDGAHPVVQGGLTTEYYTKLSHFSVGVDAGAFYAIGVDLGASVTGYMKYTF